jgi:hypothetical protein
VAGGGGSQAGCDFFVSYAEADRGWAEWVAWQLEAEGYRVLVQAWDVVAGVSWVQQMHDGVQRAARTVVVLSPRYLASAYGAAEWQAAWRADPLGKQRKLVVVRVAECDRPGLLATLVSADLFGVPAPVARQRLRETVAHAVTGRAKPPTEPAFPAGPGPVAGEPRLIPGQFATLGAELGLPDTMDAETAVRAHRHPA